MTKFPAFSSLFSFFFSLFPLLPDEILRWPVSPRWQNLSSFSIDSNQQLRCNGPLFMHPSINNKRASSFCGLEALETRSLLAGLLSEAFFEVVDAVETEAFIFAGECGALLLSFNIYNDETPAPVIVGTILLGTISAPAAKSMVHSAVTFIGSWVWEEASSITLPSESSQTHPSHGLVENLYYLDEFLGDLVVESIKSALDGAVTAALFFTGTAYSGYLSGKPTHEQNLLWSMFTGGTGALLLKSITYRAVTETSIVSQAFFEVVDAVETSLFICTGMLGGLWLPLVIYEDHDDNAPLTFSLIAAAGVPILKSVLHSAVKNGLPWMWEKFSPLALSNESKKAYEWMRVLETSDQAVEELFTLKEILPQATYLEDLHSILIHSINPALQVQAAEEILALSAHCEWIYSLAMIAPLHALIGDLPPTDPLQSRTLDALAGVVSSMISAVNQKTDIELLDKKNLALALQREAWIERITSHNFETKTQWLYEDLLAIKQVLVNMLVTVFNSTETAMFFITGGACGTYLAGKINHHNPWEAQDGEAWITFTGATTGLLLQSIRNHVFRYASAWIFSEPPAALSVQEKAQEEATELMRVIESSDQAVQGIFSLKGQIPDIHYLRGLSSIVAHCANPALQVKAAKEIVDLKYALSAGFFANDVHSIPASMQTILSSPGCDSISGPGGNACYERIHAAALQM